MQLLCDGLHIDGGIVAGDQVAGPLHIFLAFLIGLILRALQLLQIKKKLPDIADQKRLQGPVGKLVAVGNA